MWWEPLKHLDLFVRLYVVGIYLFQTEAAKARYKAYLIQSRTPGEGSLGHLYGKHPNFDRFFLFVYDSKWIQSS